MPAGRQPQCPSDSKSALLHKRTAALGSNSPPPEGKLAGRMDAWPQEGCGNRDRHMQSVVMAGRACGLHATAQPPDTSRGQAWGDDG